MNIKKRKLANSLAHTCIIIAVFILTLSFMFANVSTVIAQVPTRHTEAYLSVAPTTIGLGQSLTVNLWVYPAPATRHFEFAEASFHNITIVFTRPDGTKDQFMPVDESGGKEPGETEVMGSIWFFYEPNQVGTWSVQFSFPGDTLGIGDDAIFYEAATSQVVKFVVQKDPVNAGLLNGWPWAPLPTGYWERPINTDNREWSQISGDWLQSSYDAAATYFNPYSKAPNSPHIVWKNNVGTDGGIIGGDWGSMSYGAGGGSPSIIMNGKIYYNIPGGNFRCVNLRTGEIIYEKPGSINLGQHLVPTSASISGVGGSLDVETYYANAPSGYLWELGSTAWKRYDPSTGVLIGTISNVPGSMSTKWFEGDPVVYCIRQGGWNTTIRGKLAYNELIKWDLSKVKNNDWITGIVWNVSLKQPDGYGPGEGGRSSGMVFASDFTVGVVYTTGEDKFYAYDLNTGKQLWAKNFGYPNMITYGWVASEGLFSGWDSAARKAYAYDIKTGNQLWVSDVVGEYPWGSNTRYPGGRGVAYGNFYLMSFDGHIYAMDYKTGEIKWRYFVGNGTETIFNTWAPYISLIADGKYFFATTEHTPTQPRIRFNRLFAIDAITGEGIWSIPGAIGPVAVADGYLIGKSENDGLMYCFGKGKTATSVFAPQTAIPKGTSVLIQGTVLDQSPAQPGTPAVADESMSEWMDYLHMQNATLLNSPPTPKGVDVILTATGPDGQNIYIGTVTTDGYGKFGFDWTPPDTGIYKIQATFAGSESYWASSEETMISVTSQPSGATSSAIPTAPVSSPTPAVQPGVETSVPLTTYIAIAAAAIIAVVVAVALLLKRRAK